MKHQFFLKPSSLVLLISVLGSSVAWAELTTQDVVEARQETQIWTTFALSPFLRANDIKVTVDNGKATLTGRVLEDINKDLATQMALGVAGIKDVDNQITVEPQYVAPARSTERSYAELIDDATITSAVKSKLLWSKYADGLATDVDTKFGKVVLKGTADSKQAKELAGRLAQNTRGVLGVDNQLVVNSNKATVTEKAKSSVKEVGQEISDSWITTKVKSTFLYSSKIDSSSIKVSTNQGVVLLTGKVGSSVERKLAIDLANSLRGVKRVEARGLTL
jgi:hyperosmotically inducible periplasmic protein